MNKIKKKATKKTIKDFNSILNQAEDSANVKQVS